MKTHSNLHIDKYKEEDGTYTDSEGCNYDDAETFIQCHVLGFCGCGGPEESLSYVRDCLRHIANLEIVRESKDGEYDAAYQAWEKAGVELMGKAVYFTCYVLDQKQLTDHGVSVGGAWLTTKGKELLEDLDVILSKYEHPAYVKKD
jgi:hypothetical protein